MLDTNHQLCDRIRLYGGHPHWRPIDYIEYGMYNPVALDAWKIGQVLLSAGANVYCRERPYITNHPWLLLNSQDQRRMKALCQIIDKLMLNFPHQQAMPQSLLGDPLLNALMQ